MLAITMEGLLFKNKKINKQRIEAVVCKKSMFVKSRLNNNGISKKKRNINNIKVRVELNLLFLLDRLLQTYTGLTIFEINFT
jgi:hypothetical protein